MKRLTITDKKLIDALRRMAPETGSLICLGCGYERRCSVHGCAVLQAAVGRLEELTAPQPNDPLTLEELREMDGEPVWWEDKYERAGYGIISISEFDKAIYIVAANGTFVAIAHGEMNKHLGLTLFHRKPEEETT